jgi:hypothetical protein
MEMVRHEINFDVDIICAHLDRILTLLDNLDKEELADIEEYLGNIEFRWRDLNRQIALRENQDDH